MDVQASRSPIPQILTTLVCTAGCIGAIVLLQWPQLQQLRIRSQDAPITDLRRDLEAERVQLDLLENVPTFGYQNILADWVFLRFLQYFGDEPVRQRTDYRLSPEYFEVILKKDPFFSLAYLFMANSTSVYAGMPERAIQLTEEGLSRLSPQVPSDSFYLWQRKGIDELVFLGDTAAAQASFLTAAEWAEASSNPEGARVAANSRQTAAFLARNPDSRFAQFSSWSTVLATAQDDLTRKTAVERIEQLGGQVISKPDGTFQLVPPPSD